MEKEDVKIVVTGDICVNMLQWVSLPHDNKGLSWQTHSNMHNILKPGEALLLSEFVTAATGIPVLSPHIDDICSISNGDFLSSTVELDLFPKHRGGKSSSRVYRVKRFLGFTGPTSGLAKLLPVENDNPDADIVIIDDENNGFNAEKEYWPIALMQSGKSPVVIYKMNNPIGAGELWKHLEANHINRTIVVINAEDLRSKGVNISKSLSWEKTALDFVWQLNNNPNLTFLTGCKHLIVPFGLEGCIYYSNDKVTESRLYFLPYEFEGGFIKDGQGKMYGLTSCFVAGLVRSIITSGLDESELSIAIMDGIPEGMVYAQKYFVKGFGVDVENCQFLDPSILVEDKNGIIAKEQVQDVKINSSTNLECQNCWDIVKDKSSVNLAGIAYDIVKNGDEKALKSIPVAKFGTLKTVDRTEIESYRSIKNLMWEYISTKNTVRPLSIAVFGTPGSGKSYGLTEVASSIAPDQIKKLSFNLSQFRSPTELVKAFHRARDYSLEGKTPLVVFDEFDSEFEGKLGWLKYFLSPMQDGIFREGDSVHPIGKAIFVFAGGTSSTFQEFCDEDVNAVNNKKMFSDEFRSAKGPDFISRLRGYVNILGPNPTEGKRDQLFVIRRAMLLRSLIERKVPHLINENGEAQIDDGVLRAMLKVTRFKHEARSMEAILEMSMLTEARKWEQSHLPSEEQLKLHVDEKEFLRYLMHDAFFSEKIEALAMDIYEQYRKINEETGAELLEPWEYLSTEYKNMFRDQAKNIPDALLKINCDVIYVIKKPEYFVFNEEELVRLAEYEHMRWFAKKRDIGWKLGEVKDNEKKTHPFLVSWKYLSDKGKKNARQMVNIWPGSLASLNFKIERLKVHSKYL